MGSGRVGECPIDLSKGKKGNYLPSDTSERTPPNPSHAGWYSIYLPQYQPDTLQYIKVLPCVAFSHPRSEALPRRERATSPLDSVFRIHECLVQCVSSPLKNVVQPCYFQSASCVRSRCCSLHYLLLQTL